MPFQETYPATLSCVPINSLQKIKAVISKYVIFVAGINRRLSVTGAHPGFGERVIIRSKHRGFRKILGKLHRRPLTENLRHGG